MNVCLHAFVVFECVHVCLIVCVCMCVHVRALCLCVSVRVRFCSVFNVCLCVECRLVVTLCMMPGGRDTVHELLSVYVSAGWVPWQVQWVTGTTASILLPPTTPPHTTPHHTTPHPHHTPTGAYQRSFAPPSAHLSCRATVTGTGPWILTPWTLDPDTPPPSPLLSCRGG